MSDLQGRKVFKVFNQEFVVDERYTVTKELGQGAYGIVWYVISLLFFLPADLAGKGLTPHTLSSSGISHKKRICLVWGNR